MSTLPTRKPPMTADEARRHMADMDKKRGATEAKRTLLRMAIKHGNLTDAAKEVYAAKLETL